MAGSVAAAGLLIRMQDDQPLGDNSAEPISNVPTTKKYYIDADRTAAMLVEVDTRRFAASVRVATNADNSIFTTGGGTRTRTGN